MLGQLSEYLITFKKPFTFDGYAIEFTATEEFMQRMYELNPICRPRGQPFGIGLTPVCLWGDQLE